MENIKEKFNTLFEQENKEQAVKFILDQLKEKNLDVIDLYLEILTPALNEMVCKLEDKRICIWMEHIKTGIVRTIVECCYPYVIEKRDQIKSQNNLTAVVLCPPEEYHDLGARMVTDFFTVCGCHTIFVGSNTPYQDFYNAIDVIKPDILAVSVSDYYNLVVTKKIIKDIKDAIDYPVKVVVGGSAFGNDKEKVKMVNGDYVAKSFSDIKLIVEETIKTMK